MIVDKDSSDGRVCDVCGEPFTPEEWDDRHSPHESGCSAYDPNDDGLCDCDVEVHDRCCYECNEEEVSDETSKAI